jgi:type IV pilus assembly protein PilO
MAGFSEMSKGAQMGIILVVCAILFVCGFMFLVKPARDTNNTAQAAVDQLQAENKKLREYQPKLDELNRQMASLQQQLAIQQKIVPDQKEADKFMHLMQDTAQSAGVDIRRYTASGLNTKEFYTEVPFEMDVDGQYYSVLNFFERVNKLERIINISNLKVSTTAKPQDAKVKKAYKYSPSESVVSSFTATTFFSHDAPAPAATPAKPGTPAK